ncbi:hypothetical protein KJ059_10215 [Myxococcota bacterium]|nr:hypothetical protein [Myxococcota bacterium]MCZ7620646.1 hypothetical protein [Myxococcota bacterium]
MDSGIAVGFALFVLSSLIVGARLLLLARRTGEVPELAIGVALVAGGGLSFPLLIGALLVGDRSSPVATFAIIVGTFCGHLGAASLALAVRHIFRPTEPWARVLQLGLTGVLVMALAARASDPAEIPLPGYVFWPGMLGSLSIYAWSAAESFRLWSLMRRRVALGLANPALARRFLLWGIAAAAACGIFTSTLINRSLDPAHMHPTLLLLQTLFGVTAAVGIWLAFFPMRRRKVSPGHPAPHSL